MSTAALLLSLVALAGPPGPSPRPAQAVATFAGGCFWCEEAAFEDVPGVISVTSGYTGGTVPHPSYEQVETGGTGHAEAVEVVYDPSRIGYAELLRIFWHNVDPTTPNREFCDVGEQYRSAIFYHGEEQRQEAEASRAEIERSKRFPEPIVTRIVAAGAFWPAEEYHQRYAKKNPVRYRYYRWNCGRDQRLRELWGAEAGGH